MVNNAGQRKGRMRYFPGRKCDVIGSYRLPEQTYYTNA